MTDETKKEPTLSELVPQLVVGDLTFESQLADDLYVNRSDLNGEFIRHPERFGFYATCYEIAASRENEYKILLERLYAAIDQEKRGFLKMTGDKATEKVVENMVISDDRYIALQNNYVEAQKQAAICKAAMSAMQHRKDMLIQLGSAAREEFKADVSLKMQAHRAANGG